MGFAALRVGTGTRGDFEPERSAGASLSDSLHWGLLAGTLFTCQRAASGLPGSGHPAEVAVGVAGRAASTQGGRSVGNGSRVGGALSGGRARARLQAGIRTGRALGSATLIVYPTVTRKSSGVKM